MNCAHLTEKYEGMIVEDGIAWKFYRCVDCATVRKEEA